MLDTLHTPICTTFKDYATTLPTREQDLLLQATEKPSTIPLYALLNQKHTTLLAVSDGGADVPNNYGSFGWVLGTEHEILWETKASHEAIQCNLTARKGMVEYPYSRSLHTRHTLPGNTNI
jgi:hypothetical protein